MKKLLQLLLIIILLCTQAQTIKAEGLLRLFTTPAQRAALDAARAKPVIKKRVKKSSIKKTKRKKRVKKSSIKKTKRKKRVKKLTVKIKKPKKRKLAKKSTTKKRITKPKKRKLKKRIQKPPVKIKKIEQPKIVKKAPIKKITKQKQTKPKKIETKKPKLPRYISFEGLMTRSDGTTTIWINGKNHLYREGFTIEIDKIKPDYSIPIILTYTKQIIILKPGQTYDTLEGKIKESYMIQ
jgi:hypothetical protein